MSKIIKTTFQLRRCEASWYAEHNPVLNQGEPAFEIAYVALELSPAVIELMIAGNCKVISDCVHDFQNVTALRDAPDRRSLCPVPCVN